MARFSVGAKAILRMGLVVVDGDLTDQVHGQDEMERKGLSGKLQVFDRVKKRRPGNRALALHDFGQQPRSHLVIRRVGGSGELPVNAGDVPSQNGHGRELSQLPSPGMGRHDLRQRLHFLAEERESLKVTAFFDGLFAERHPNYIGREQHPSFLVEDAVLG